MKPRVKGHDQHGNPLVVLIENFDAGGDYLIPLTPCCLTDGTGSAGSPTGVACRGCYAPVPAYFGTRGEVTT